MNPDLPPQRKRAYEFIVEHHANTGAMPSAKQIADHMGWKNAGSVTSDLFWRLRADGLMDDIGREYYIDAKGAKRTRNVWKLRSAR